MAEQDIPAGLQVSGGFTDEPAVLAAEHVHHGADRHSVIALEVPHSTHPWFHGHAHKRRGEA